MRIVMFLRLFSGLEAGLRDRVWQPRGVPTIAKLIEELDRGPNELKLVFACHDHAGTWACGQDQSFAVDGLNTPVNILAGEARFPKIFGRLRSRLVILRQFLQVWSISRAHNADLVYIDRGNMWVASWMARLTKFPVVWRVMGVLPAMHQALVQTGWRSLLMRFGFRAPYAQTICTLDGSGGGNWMKRTVHLANQTHVMLNGIDWVRVDELEAMSLPSAEGKTMVLFVGRLENNKGCDVFLQAFAKAASAHPGQLHAVVVGDGSERQNLQSFVEGDENLAEAVTFTGAVAAQDVLRWQKRADIYVSLNRMGNLSNANLEALACGTCLVIPSSRPDEHVDEDTDTFLPHDVALRYGHVDDTNGLVEAILALHTNPVERATRAQKTKAFAEQNIPSWEKRVREELDILEAVAH